MRQKRRHKSFVDAEKIPPTTTVDGKEREDAMPARGYRQYTITDGRSEYASLPAPSPVDALARFAMREYTDPRILATQDRDMDPFFYHDGAVWMVYENLQLTAV